MTVYQIRSDKKCHMRLWSELVCPVTGLSDVLLCCGEPSGYKRAGIFFFF